MNGRFSSPDPNSGRAGKVPDRYRLVTALVLSCVLHLALLGAAYLGGKTRENPPVAAAGRQFPQPFSASLQVTRQARPVTRQETGLAVDPAEGPGVLPLAAPPYYPTDQLSKRPQPLGSADLEGPEIRPIVASGKIVLKLWIDEFGAVNKVEVDKTELPEVFSLSTAAAFKRLQFTPGERGGVRVGSVMKIEVSYDDVRSPAPRE